MRLAVADPPYLGRAHWYTNGGGPSGWRTNGTMKPADHHDDARIWDDPAEHVRLVERLDRDYDGWAVAMARDSLPVYLGAAPDARVCVWHNPAAWPPGGSRIHATWEPVLVRVPAARAAAVPVNRKPMAAMSPRERAAVESVRPKDVLIAVPPRRLGFTGAKPAAWTRWVLDMLGYDPESDTVDDLFPGSGAVGRETLQGVLL